MKPVMDSFEFLVLIEILRITFDGNPLWDPASQCMKVNILKQEDQK